MTDILLIVLKKRKYLLIALATSLIVAAASYYLTVINVSHRDIFIYMEMNGVIFTIISMSLGMIIAFLFGSYAALLSFVADISIKSNSTKEKTGSLAGIAANMLASGCPSCGVPLLGLIGFPFGLALLPFKGIELKVVSIFLLYFSTNIIIGKIKKDLKNTKDVRDNYCCNR